MNIALLGDSLIRWGLADCLSRTRFGVVFGAISHEAGHEIAESFVTEHQRAVQGGFFEQAIRVSEVALLGCPLSQVFNGSVAAEALTGKILIDLNPVFTGLPQSQAEQEIARLQNLLPETRIVVAYNPGQDPEAHSLEHRPKAVVLFGHIDAMEIATAVLSAAGMEVVQTHAVSAASEEVAAERNHPENTLIRRKNHG